MAIRRELAIALRKVDNMDPVTAEGIKLQTIQTGIFASALRVVECFDPEHVPESKSSGYHVHPSHIQNHKTDPSDPAFNHFLSRTAHKVAKSAKPPALMPLLCGPLAILSFPVVSTLHLKAALSILAPSPPNFPAPTRRANPGYHDPLVQAGLQKLMLLAARVEGKIFDTEGTRWIGSISGGIDGLRAELVMLLQGIGGGLTTTLEGVGRNLYFTMEGRKGMLEDAEKPAAAESPVKEEEVKA
jgi:large subunit ribosomal protein L10